jgi:hypothetical protein
MRNILVLLGGMFFNFCVPKMAFVTGIDIQHDMNAKQRQLAGATDEKDGKKWKCKWDNSGRSPNCGKAVNEDGSVKGSGSAESLPTLTAAASEPSQQRFKSSPKATPSGVSASGLFVSTGNDTCVACFGDLAGTEIATTT